MKKSSFLLFLFAIVISTAGCAGSAPGFKTVKSDNMPIGGIWDGVYFSQAYGRLELTAKGSMVYGLYESERWHGKIEGEADGNVLNFRWTQFNEDLNGKSRATTGHGYFVYTAKDEGTLEKPRITHFIDGEWGYGESNTGNTWKAVKFPDGTKKIIKINDDDSEDKPVSSDPFSNPGSAPSNNNTSSGSGLDSNSGSSSGSLDADVNDLF